MAIDVLNLEWPSSARDHHITAPVCFALKSKYNLNVVTGSIFEGFWLIIRYRPKLVLLSNYMGSAYNFEIVKFARSLGVVVISMVSEGVFSEEAVAPYMWGVNKDKVFYPNCLFVWSEKTKEMIYEKMPELRGHVFVGGGVGFDRYKICKFLSKSEFLSRNGLQKYQKVIGIAGWGFDLLAEGDYFNQNKDIIVETCGWDQIHMHRSDLFKMQTLIRDLVKSYPDILFIFRYHPGVIDFKKSEFALALDNPNVFVSSLRNQDGYEIEDLIHTCDLWVSYESTTNLEAWLLDKTTFSMNPSGGNFRRSPISRGNPVATNLQDVQKFIDSFYTYGKIDDFVNLKNVREEIIKDVIGFDDGKNHLRTAALVAQELLKPKVKKLPLSIKNIYIALKTTAKSFIIGYHKDRPNLRSKIEQKYRGLI